MNSKQRATDSKDLYVGLSGLHLDGKNFEFGHGVLIRPTFAHIFSTDILAFAPPKTPHSFHPGPWQAASRRKGIDVTAELFVPKDYKHPRGTTMQAARTIASLLRLWTDPQICTQLLTHQPIADLKQNEYSGMDDPHVALLTGDRNRHIDFQRATKEGISESIAWVATHWEDALTLRCEAPEFDFALETFDNAQLIPNTAMMLVSIWGALEAVFAPSSAELRFRVSANIAAFLEPRGVGRISKQREVAKLYDSRSAAAHGTPKHGPEELLQTFELLRRAIIRMIQEKAVPSRARLDELLFAY